MEELTGQRLGIAACGIRAVAKKMFELNHVEVETVVEVVETPQEVTKAVPKAVKKTTTKKVNEPANNPAQAESTEVVGAVAEAAEVEKPKAAKPIKSFDKKVIGDGVKVAYRADLTEQMADIKTPMEFENFFKELPENCGLVSRTAPYFTREWTLRIISGDEKTKLSLNDVTGRFDVLTNGEKDAVMTADLRAAVTHDAVMRIAQIEGAVITNGKKTFPTGEGCKYGVMLICHMTSKTRLKTLATDFAIVELV